MIMCVAGLHMGPVQVCREGSQADTQLMVMLRMRDLAQDGAFGGWGLHKPA